MNSRTTAARVGPSASSRIGALLSTCTLALLLATGSAGASQATTFDFDTGNSPIEIIIPTVRAATLKNISAGDASIILRMTTLVTNGWFDAIAPYHPTAVGVYSRIARRPPGEGLTDRNRNVAILYATYRILSSTMPKDVPTWLAMMKSVSLDPDDDRMDQTTAVGIGNSAAAQVLAARLRDGMNQLGDEGGRRYQLHPYDDYTGYQPVNSAFELRDPSRWQPNVVTGDFGLFQTQKAVTPQWGRTRPYTYESAIRFRAPPPTSSQWTRDARAHRGQADELVAISAALTDEQKMVAELFNHKFFSLGRVAGFVSASRGQTLEQFVHYDFMANVAAFDGGIATWNEKFRYDAVRPFSAIRFLYGDSTITAWGGPGKGTVNDLTGKEWRSYLPTADHPEYPSGSACFCAAHAQASRRYLGSDALGWQVPAPRGSSVIEPGVTPRAAITLSFESWTSFENQCALSRLYGGVHFRAAVEAGAKLCKPMGDLAFEFVDSHIKGMPNTRSDARHLLGDVGSPR